VEVGSSIWDFVVYSAVTTLAISIDIQKGMNSNNNMALTIEAVILSE
jgi:hypothetical protein